MDELNARDNELLRTITTRIAEAVCPEKIILFGSWARGERGPHSDIDLLIIQESDLSRPQRYAQVRRLFWGMGVPVEFRYPDTLPLMPFEPVRAAADTAVHIYAFVADRL